MRKIKICILLTFGVAISFFPSAAISGSYDSLKLQDIDNRLKNLENYNENLKQLYEINAGRLEQSMNTQIKEQLKDLDESKKILSRLLWIGIPSTLIGLLGAYFLAIGKAKKIIVDKIETIVEHKREEIIKVIETQEFDSKLRKEKKVLILSPNESSQERIKNLFPKFKFKNVNYRIVDQFREFTDNDIIVFNNEDGSCRQELINQYLEHYSADSHCFVAYTTVNLDRDPRINFSNSPFTLYHNILSTLKYNEILKLNENTI